MRVRVAGGVHGMGWDGLCELVSQEIMRRRVQWESVLDISNAEAIYSFTVPYSDICVRTHLPAITGI